MIKINSLLKYLLVVCWGVAASLAVSASYAEQDLISQFPIDHYDQKISSWINSNDENYDTPILKADIQQKHFDLYYTHYFGSLSPWNAEYVTRILRHSSPDDIKSTEQAIIRHYSNERKSGDQIGYGENFHPHDKEWISKIAENIDIDQFSGLTYQANNRGIAIDNLHARALPTDDVYFYSHKLAGQGYPFDNLQISALWAGTPVYIVGETRDHAWMLVITPDFIGWVKSSGIARADNGFITAWSKSAKYKLFAITRTQTSIVNEKSNFLFSAYVGAVFPGNDTGADSIKLMVPAADSDHYAVIKYANVPLDSATPMPLMASPHHFADLMNALIGRPYGWGGMYFYNDCSAELKSLLAPFGIWLPRHSSQQVTVGKMVDMSSATAEKRLAYLRENGERFLTLVYIGGHVVMYIGNDNNHVLTYQNMWGLSPSPSTRREVIGRSVIFPMLLKYSEDTGLNSQANKKFFQVSYLSQLSDKSLLTRERLIDIRALMFPDL